MSRIPLPIPFGQSMMQGLTQGAGLASQLQRQNIANQQLAMAQQMQPWKVKMIQSQIAQAQADEAYKQKILPGLLQQQADAHRQAQLNYDPQAKGAYQNALINAEFGPQTGTTGTTPNIGALSQPLTSTNDMIKQLMGGDSASKSLATSGIVDPSSLMQPQQQAPQQTPQMPPAMMQMLAQQAQQKAQQSATQPIGAPQQGIQSGSVQPVQSGQTPLAQVMQRVQNGTASPVDYLKLRAAGFNLKPGEFQTPEQKEQLAVKQATQIAQAQASLAGQTAEAKAAGAANVKKANTALANLRTLSETDATVNKLNDIVQNNPSIFSYIKAPYESKFSSDPDVGTVNTLGGQLVASMAHAISSRAPLGTQNYVKTIKPGIDRSPQIAAGNIAALNLLKEKEKVNNILDYHDATGDFPNIPGMEKYVAQAKQELESGKSNALKPSSPTFSEGFTRKIGNDTYVWSGGKWHHS